MSPRTAAREWRRLGSGYGAALADEAEGLALLDGEGDSVDGNRILGGAKRHALDDGLPGFEPLDQVLHLDERGAVRVHRPISVWNGQAVRWPRSTSSSSIETSRRDASSASANSQRGANGQPGGRVARSGGWPRIGTSLPSARSAASSGRAFRS